MRYQCPTSLWQFANKATALEFHETNVPTHASHYAIYKPQEALVEKIYLKKDERQIRNGKLQNRSIADPVVCESQSITVTGERKTKRPGPLLLTLATSFECRNHVTCSVIHQKSFNGWATAVLIYHVTPGHFAAAFCYATQNNLWRHRCHALS